MRKIQFINNEYYHIYNRGIDKREIFLDEEDYLKFLRSLKDFNNQSYYEQRAQIVRSSGFKELSSFLEQSEKIVEVVCYCLVSNHFHLILKQINNKGISNFLHKIGTSLTNFFNKKYQRSGSLFQGPYKAVHINNNDYLLWLSAYINGNIQIHGITNAQNYKWSSYKNYLKLENDEVLVNNEIILSQFKNIEEYKNFVEVVIKESKNRKDMEKYLLEKI